MKQEQKEGIDAFDPQLERDKAMGITPEQLRILEYHEGEFKRIDPVTGLPREKPLP